MKGHEDILSDIEDVKGTEPVRRTTIIPSVNKVIPRAREKYSSSAVVCQLRIIGSLPSILTCRPSDFRRKESYHDCRRCDQRSRLKSKPSCCSVSIRVEDLEFIS
jgi:hypothetical protein